MFIGQSSLEQRVIAATCDDSIDVAVIAAYCAVEQSVANTTNRSKIHALSAHVADVNMVGAPVVQLATAVLMPATPRIATIGKFPFGNIVNPFGEIVSIVRQKNQKVKDLDLFAQVFETIVCLIKRMSVFATINHARRPLR